jgi:hypothetical protein
VSDLLEELEDPENVLASLGEGDVFSLESRPADRLLTTAGPKDRAPSELNEEPGSRSASIVVTCVVRVGPYFEKRGVSVTSEDDPEVESSSEVPDDALDGGPVNGPKVGAVSANGVREVSASVWRSLSIMRGLCSSIGVLAGLTCVMLMRSVMSRE